LFSADTLASSDSVSDQPPDCLTSPTFSGDTASTTAGHCRDYAEYQLHQQLPEVTSLSCYIPDTADRHQASSDDRPPYEACADVNIVR